MTRRMLVILLFAILRISPLTTVECMAEMPHATVTGSIGPVTRLAGHPSLYSQTMRIPFFETNKKSVVTILADSPMVPGERSGYMSISINEKELYQNNWGSNKQAEFLGTCFDPQTGRANLLIREYDNFRGEQPRYIIWTFSEESGTAEENEIGGNVYLRTLITFTHEPVTRIDKGKNTPAHAQQLTIASAKCSWQQSTALHQELDRLLRSAANSKISSHNSPSHIPANTRLPLPKTIFEDRDVAIIELVKQVIERGDERYHLTLQDAGTDSDIYTIRYNIAPGAQLSDESTGLVILHNKSNKRWKPLFRLDPRPYPYDGVCESRFWFENKKLLNGWLAEGGQPCKYYPVVVDLDRQEYFFLSTQYRYEITDKPISYFDSLRDKVND